MVKKKSVFFPIHKGVKKEMKMIRNFQFLYPKITAVNILLSSFQILPAHMFAQECSIYKSRLWGT